MQDRRQFLKQTAMITAAGLGKVTEGRGVVPSRGGPDGGATEKFEALAAGSNPKDIRMLSQHFNEPGGDISPWLFIPADNIKEISTTDHPGVVAVWQAGKGEDIRGILKNPIRIEDYPLPWEFELGLVQNYWASLLGLGDPKQNNYAIGLNVVLTFSDPSDWPTDRTQRPPDTRSFQLFVVHLGSTGEYCRGLPQFSTERGRPETFLVWGRGDLDDKINGNWDLAYVYTGLMPNSGTASHEVYFRTVMESPTRIRVGICFRAWDDFEERVIDCSRFGRITGVWEIGPIFSCDRWIPDELCKKLPVLHHVSNPPEPVPPNPVFEFYVDYCVFFYDYPASPFEHYSDDFDVLGYLGQWRGFQIPFSAETWSNPGYLTITLLGADQGVWFGPRTLDYFDLEVYEPPWEMEICFTAPDDSAPWNLSFHHMLYDKNKHFVGFWDPGVQNFPAEKRHRFVNCSGKKMIFDDEIDWPAYLKRNPENIAADDTSWALDPAKRCPIDVQFDPEIPEEVLAAKPLCMLYQLIDRGHVRIGFRGGKEGTWHLSKPFDLTTMAKDGIGKIGEACWQTLTGRVYHLPAGSPMYQKLLIDYVHYRRGLS